MVLRIFKIIATSAPNSFSAGTGGAYSAPPGPLADLRGPISKGEGKGKTEPQRGKGEEGKEGTGPRFTNSWIRPWVRL